MLKHIAYRCCHITNPEVNKSKGIYVNNFDPDSCNGHKWRLKWFWSTLKEEGVDEDAIRNIKNQINDIVIKTLLSVDSNIRKDFSERSSMYNCYSLTGIVKINTA